MTRVLSTAGAVLVLGALLLAAPASASVTPASVTPNVQVNPPRDPANPTQDFRSPVIAINPTNPDNVVMAARTDEPDYFCRVYYSNDGGASWSPATGSGATFPDPIHGTCWSPGVAFDAAGNVYVVAQDRPVGGGSPTTVSIWKSTNGGQKFGPPLTIPPSERFGTSSFSVQADIAIDTTPSSPHFGRIYVTWHEFPNFLPLRVVLTYSDNGVDWSSVTQRPIPSQSQDMPDLTVAPDGTVYDIFKAGSNFFSGGTKCASLTNGGSVPASGTECPVQILRSSDGGVSFDADPFTVGTTFFPGGPDNAVVDTAVGEEPSVVVTPSGTLLAAVATVPETPAPGCAASLQAVVYRSTDRGETWSGPQTLNDDACSSGNEHRDPRLSVAPNGRIDVAFYDNRFDRSHVLYDVVYANSTDDGLTFGPNTRLSDARFDGAKLFEVRPANSPPNNFQTRDYDTVTGLASLDNSVVAAWGDTRNGPNHVADLFSARILGFLAPASPATPPAAALATPPPTSPPAGPVRDTTRPVISGLSVVPARFTIGSLLPRLAHVARVGTTIRFSLSERAAVRLSFARRHFGRRVGHACRVATRALRHRPRCVRYVSVYPSIHFARVRPGANRVRFQGRLSRTRTLRPGRYRLTATATDPSGNRSRPKRVSLTARRRSRTP